MADCEEPSPDRDQETFETLKNPDVNSLPDKEGTKDGDLYCCVWAEFRFPD